MVGFDDGIEMNRSLNGSAVPTINADLTGSIDLTQRKRLRENAKLAFMATVKVGPFELSAETAQEMLRAPLNPNGRPNSDVARPWVNALDITRRRRDMRFIDFGVNMTEADAALYEAPFEYVRKYVYPIRSQNRKAPYAKRWWLFAETCPGMREALVGKSRYIVTPTVAKHRVFAWLDTRTVPDHALMAIASDDDYFFGVFHSRPHQLWTLRAGTQLRELESGFRYTPTTTFETFPFPWRPGTERPGDPRVEAIADAARDLVAKRDARLNPPGASAAELRQRTLTNLYNQRPTWLQFAHRQLDQAVLDASGWPHDISDEGILERLLELNLARAPA